MPDYPNEFILIGSHCWAPSISRPIRAREERADFYFKQCLEIADRGKDEEESQARTKRDRLRVYTRKRLAPKKYGDHIAHDVQGNTTLNFQPAVSDHRNCSEFSDYEQVKPEAE